MSKTPGKDELAETKRIIERPVKTPHKLHKGEPRKVALKIGISWPGRHRGRTVLNANVNGRRDRHALNPLHPIVTLVLMCTTAVESSMVMAHFPLLCIADRSCRCCS